MYETAAGHGTGGVPFRFLGLLNEGSVFLGTKHAILKHLEADLLDKVLEGRQERLQASARKGNEIVASLTRRKGEKQIPWGLGGTVRSTARRCVA